MPTIAHARRAPRGTTRRAATIATPVANSSANAVAKSDACHATSAVWRIASHGIAVSAALTNATAASERKGSGRLIPPMMTAARRIGNALASGSAAVCVSPVRGASRGGHRVARHPLPRIRRNMAATDPRAAAPRLYALVPCAGSGTRAASGGPKQYAVLAGRAVVGHTLAALAAVPRIVGTWVVLAADDTQFEAHVPRSAARGVTAVRRGGATRAASVAAGLAALRASGARDGDWVLVHDAARCLLRPAAVDRLIDACVDDAVGGLLALPLADTLKSATATDGDAPPRVAATLDRAAKWLAQTPQMFRIGLLDRALRAAGASVTDESGAVEALGLQPRLVAGDVDNLKLTWPADFDLAERLLRARSVAAGTDAIFEETPR